MSRRHYNLPPLTMLLVFEAAARHLSFKLAARDLSVSPAAVSHQIKALEAELGVPLFTRKHRGVELTDHGTGLRQVLSRSFSDISQELEKIRRAGLADTVTVGATTAVAAHWLSPAIIDFWQSNPAINVNQVTQDRPFQDAQAVEFYIQYGASHEAGQTSQEIYRDELVAVAAPHVAQGLAECTLDQLAAQRLVHLKVLSQDWTTWPEWFAGLGYSSSIQPTTTVTNYAVALQIAQKGAGIALGWRHLLGPMITNGTLAVVGAHRLRAPHPFCLVGPPSDQLSDNAQKLRAWILAQHPRS